MLPNPRTPPPKFSARGLLWPAHRRGWAEATPGPQTWAFTPAPGAATTALTFAPGLTCAPMAVAFEDVISYLTLQSEGGWTGRTACLGKDLTWLSPDIWPEAYRVKDRVSAAGRFWVLC